MRKKMRKSNKTECKYRGADGCKRTEFDQVFQGLGFNESPDYS